MKLTQPNYVINFQLKNTSRIFHKLYWSHSNISWSQSNFSLNQPNIKQTQPKFFIKLTISAIHLTQLPKNRRKKPMFEWRSKLKVAGLQHSPKEIWWITLQSFKVNVHHVLSKYKPTPKIKSSKLLFCSTLCEDQVFRLY